MPVVTATQRKTATSDGYDLLAANQAVVIHRHDKPRGVLLSVEQYQSISGQQPEWLDGLKAECQAMFEEMQSPGRRDAALRLFTATPEELGAAAVRGLRATLMKPTPRRALLPSQFPQF